jgi:hypothetical protein
VRRAVDPFSNPALAVPFFRRHPTSRRSRSLGRRSPADATAPSPSRLAGCPEGMVTGPAGDAIGHKRVYDDIGRQNMRGPDKNALAIAVLRASH